MMIHVHVYKLAGVMEYDVEAKNGAEAQRKAIERCGHDVKENGAVFDEENLPEHRLLALSFADSQ